jgi:hypothetical protein
MNSSRAKMPIASWTARDLAKDRSDLFKSFYERVTAVYDQSDESALKQSTDKNLVDLRSWLNTEVIEAKEAKRGFLDVAVFEFDKHWMDFVELCRLRAGGGREKFDQSLIIVRIDGRRLQDRELNGIANVNITTNKTLGDLWLETAAPAQIGLLCELVAWWADKRILPAFKTFLDYAADHLALYGTFPGCETLTRLAQGRFNEQKKEWENASEAFIMHDPYDRGKEEALNLIMCLTPSPMIANDPRALSECVALALRSGGMMPRKDLLLSKIKKLLFDVITKST